jgi:paired amphipathic helix protein Sin3a
VQIFKKDDKTFDVETMGAQARWQYYVSSFVMRDWTEGVPHNIRWPFLRRNLPKDLETAEDYSQVYLPQWNEDGLVVRIALNSYHLLYDPETFDWWVHDDKVRIRGLKGLKEFIEERNRRFEMKFVEKAPWKNGMTPNEIDETLSGFTKWYGNTVDAAPVSSVDAAKFDEIMSGV